MRLPMLGLAGLSCLAPISAAETHLRRRTARI